MLPSRKIYMGITGAALVALGIICIGNPLSTVISLAWVLGIITLVSGFATLLNWLNVRKYFPQSGSVLLSSVLQIVVGFIFLRHDLAFATIIPIVFALFLIIEGANLAIRSFDYRKVGFRFWWLNLCLGLLATLLGFLSFCVPGVGGTAVSLFIGLGFVIVGLVYLVALCAINRFEKKVSSDPWIDEQ